MCPMMACRSSRLGAITPVFSRCSEESLSQRGGGTGDIVRLHLRHVGTKFLACPRPAIARMTRLDTPLLNPVSGREKTPPGADNFSAFA